MIKLYKYDDVPAQLLEASASHLFYTQRWLSVLRRQYGCEYFITHHQASGAVMVFALIRCLVGKKIVSLPFSDYTRPSLVNPAELLAHVQVLREAFPDLPLCLKINFPNAADELNLSSGIPGNPRVQGHLHRVDTRQEVQLEKRMLGSFRRGVRKANAAGLNFVSNCSREGLEQFYRLFYTLRIQKHGLIPQPFDFFEKIFEEFISCGKGFFAEVWKNDCLLASAIILSHEDGLYYKWGCSSINGLKDRPNNLLFYDLLHLAQRDGYAFVDLGLSDLKVNQGLMRFKKSMGGSPSVIYSYQFLPDDYPFETIDQFKTIVDSMASIVVASGFDRKTTDMFSQTLYPLFA